MRFRPETGIGLFVLALVAIWPFWHAHCRDNDLQPLAEQFPEALPPVTTSPPSVLEASARAPQAACSGCGALRRLARRLRSREEGAARRFEAAANRLSTTGAGTPGPADRRELELALRRAQDDKRGAAAFRSAVLQAVRQCERGPGCGGAPLMEHWDEGCPPEQPDLGRETAALSALAQVLARKASACAAAACPDVDCERNARILRLLAAADRELPALANLPHSTPGPGAVAGDAVRALLNESEQWHGGVAALFLGGAEPSAQIMAAAQAASSLAVRLADVRKPGGSKAATAAATTNDPYWRLQVLSVRLERIGNALVELASAMRSDAPDRDSVLFGARQRAAAALHDLLITQMRIRSARQQGPAGAEILQRCARRRQAQIARARGQIRSLRAALVRCAGRAVCGAAKTQPVDASPPGYGLDPVSTLRVRLDQNLDQLRQLAPSLDVQQQGRVDIDTVRPRYESGEAVAVRINLRVAACMADEGSWVGLFAERAPPLRGSEIADAAVRRLNLRGRPWEEVLFEAPSEPGRYEVRTYASERRGGTITGKAQFDVTPRQKGCRGFSGTWRTNFGRLQITVRDREARGSYKRPGNWRAGFLTGKVRGRVLLGEWQSDLGAGGTRLVLSENGKSLSGTWSHFRDAFAGTGVWTGTCEGPVSLPEAPEED